MRYINKRKVKEDANVKTFTNYNDFLDFLKVFDFSNISWEKRKLGTLHVIRKKIGSLWFYFNFGLNYINIAVVDDIGQMQDTYINTRVGFERVDFFDFRGDGSSIRFDFFMKSGNTSFTFD